MKHFQFLCYNHHVLNKGGLKMKDLEQLYETVKKRNPNDKEFLRLSKSEKEDLLLKFPDAGKIIRRQIGSAEFINDIERYCYWISDEDLELAIRLCSEKPLTLINEPLINIYDVDKPRKAERVEEAKEKLLKYSEKIINGFSEKDQKIIYAKQYLSIARAYAAEGDRKNTFKFLKKSVSYKFLFSDRFKVLPQETYFMILLLLLKNL